jgi:phage pi2 protein 07
MRNLVIFSTIVTIFLNSCGRDNDPEAVISKESLGGFVQKGPFVNGTSITINELTEDLSQTGKTFNTQITDNKGSFTFNNVSLVSNYVSLKADGFYFNEILGEQSASQITLYALSDVSDKNSINVNILSHLEKPRIEYLIFHGTGFGEAKTQAQSEILAIFNVQKEDMKSSEELDISKQGDDNAVLLAISLILQGYRTEGELTELLSNIGSDITEDGELTTADLGSQLINQAVILDTITIRNNLESRYEDLGVSAEIPHFEKYLKNFIDNTSFEFTEIPIEYPESGLYGENILDVNKTQYTDDNFSLAANLAKGTSLKIKISFVSGGLWYYSFGSGNNWSITNYDMENKIQYFTAVESDKACDLHMLFDQGEFLIEYFEMGKTEPSRSKIITIVNGSFGK